MRIINRHRRSEEGTMLMMALIASMILGLTLGAYLTMVSNQNRSVVRSTGWNSAVAITEAGIEEAMSQLHYADLTNLASNGWTSNNGAYIKKGMLNGNYYVAAISNVNPPVIYSQGFVMSPLETNYVSRTVRVTTARDALYGKGMVAKGQIDINGNNVMTDSFDSANTNYSTAGQYDSTKAKDGGDVATNSRMIDSLNVWNAKIKGRVSTGPGGTVEIGPNGSVGDMAWVNGGTKGIESGRGADDMNVYFPDVTAPYTSGGTIPSSGNVGGTNYDYVLGSGNYQLANLNNKMLVQGNATLLVTDGINLTGNDYILLAPGATLTMYVSAASASLAGKGVINSAGNATNFYYYGLPSNTSLSFSGNAAFTGVIYAPQAAFSLNGSGNSTYDFVGASITSSVRMNGNFKFHYDENLARVGPSRGFVLTSWNEL